MKMRDINEDDEIENEGEFDPDKAELVAAGDGAFALYRQSGELYLVNPGDNWNARGVPAELDKPELKHWERVSAARHALLQNESNAGAGNGGAGGSGGGAGAGGGYWNRFDIVLAHYVFCSLLHEGQGSRLYERLSRITSYFTPGAMGVNLEFPENENAREIYFGLCRRHGVEHEGEIRC